jgi:hypothetical protein
MSCRSPIEGDAGRDFNSTAENVLIFGELRCPAWRPNTVANAIK